MAWKVTSQKGWAKGVIAVSNRFSVPKGAVLQALNMLMGERGALQTCDGSLIQSAIPGGAGPIITLGNYEPDSFSSTLVALAISGTNQYGIYNFNTNPATLITNGALTAGWTHPQFFMFGGVGIITNGNNQATYNFNGSAVSDLTTQPGWQANTLYQIGDKIVTLGSRTFQVIGLSLTFSTNTGSNTSQTSSNNPVTGSGFSGNTEPNWSAIPVTDVGAHIDDNQLVWQYIAATSNLGAQAVPWAGAHGIVYAGALWLWNTAPNNSVSQLDGPSVIRQSTVNNPNSWPSVNMAYVNRDDGDYGNGIATFTIAEAGISPTGSLVLFKNFSTYQVTGVFGAQNFAIQQVQSDMGCVACRTPVFCTGSGVARLTHLGVGLFDGVHDQLISAEINPYIFGRADIPAIDWANVQNSRAALVVNPPMYILGVPTVGSNGIIQRVLCYDLVLKGWLILDVSQWGGQGWSAINQIRVPGAGPVTTYVGDGSLSLGQSAYNVRRIQSGDLTADGVAIPWSFTPPAVGDPGSRAYFRRSMVRGHALTSGTMTMAASLGAAALPAANDALAPAGPNSSGINAPNVVGQASYEGDQDLAVSFDIAETAPSIVAQYSGTGKVTIEGIDYQLIIKPPRPFGQAA
jgi:hypothetical protein